jgi:hypothetical protein
MGYSLGLLLSIENMMGYGIVMKLLQYSSLLQCERTSFDLSDNRVTGQMVSVILKGYMGVAQYQSCLYA